MTEPLIFDKIAIYKNAIPNPSELIEAANSEFDKSLYDVSGSSGVVKLVLQPLSTPALQGVREISRTAIGGCVRDYGGRFGMTFATDASSTYSMLRYFVGQGKGSHVDCAGSERRVSVVGYLNDDFLGGELVFGHLSFRYTPVAGDVLVFPSVAPYFHAITPVTEGVRYAVINWWA